MAEFGKKKKKEKANAVKPSTGAQGTSMTAIRIGGLGAEIAKWKGQQARLGHSIACCAYSDFSKVWSNDFLPLFDYSDHVKLHREILLRRGRLLRMRDRARGSLKGLPLPRGHMFPSPMHR